MENRVKNKIAVIYHYFEANQNYRDNLIYFLSVAIRDDIDFYIIIAGDCSVSLPEAININYLRTKNKNNDYGGYVEFLKNFKITHDFYVFINSSVRGPFLPNYYDGCWVDPFISRLYDRNHLVGASINNLSISSDHSVAMRSKYDYLPPFNHVQTTAYALTCKALEHLYSIGFYGNEEVMTKDEVILNYEIRLSCEIRKQGWSISSISQFDADFDYVVNDFIVLNPSAHNGDSQVRHGFYSRSFTPYDLIFIKTSRNILLPEDLASYTYAFLERLKSNPELSETLNLKYKCYEEIKKAYIRRRNFKKLIRFFGLKRLILNLARLI